MLPAIYARTMISTYHVLLLCMQDNYNKKVFLKVLIFPNKLVTGEILSLTADCFKRID